MSDFIHLETRFLEINEGEHLSDAFAREKYPLNSIPTNCILDKTLPGLGATHSEIMAKRDSIIIEPNVPVIEGKVSERKNLLGVIEECTKKDIKEYLFNSKIKHKKIISTPEGYKKIKEVADEYEINLYENFFMLFDECEKITQDIDYRKQISLPINDFFMYKEKAFVSATPLDMRNLEFLNQEFYNLIVKPLYQYKKNIDLITTNRYETAVIEKLNELKENECICVFMNSTNGINKLINHLEKQKINDYKAFCSKKSAIKFKDRDIFNSYESLNLPLAKYNFFTSRFFSAVDIVIDKKPDIIILTDIYEAKYSRIDPFTNSIQTYGRFRHTFPDGKKFNSLTHITNYGDGETILDESEIESYILQCKKNYEQLKEDHDDELNKGKKKALSEAMKQSPYLQFIDDDGTINYFKVDNFYDNERIKDYYTSPSKIFEAYKNTKHFIVNHVNLLSLVGDKELLEYKKRKRGKEKLKFLVQILDAIYNSQNSFTPEQIKSIINDLLKVEDRKTVKHLELTIEAYEKLGAKAIKKVNYSITEIKKLLKNDKIEFSKQKIFSKEVRDAILRRFPENHTYKKDELFNGFSEIFKNYGIDEKVNLSTIKKYYGIREKKGKETKGFIRLDLFNKELISK